MTTITSAAAFFRAAAGKQIKKTVTGVVTLETWPAVRDNAIEQLRAQGCAEKDITIDPETGDLRWPGGFMFKPKFHAVEVGTLQIRSGDYGFVSENYPKPVWGDKKGAKVEDGKLVKFYPDRGMTIAFEIVA